MKKKSVTCQGYAGRSCETETRHSSGICQICRADLAWAKKRLDAEIEKDRRDR